MIGLQSTIQMINSTKHIATNSIKDIVPGIKVMEEYEETTTKKEEPWDVVNFIIIRNL